MYKINTAYERNNLLGENDIYRKFNIEFESLFNPDEIAKSDAEFDELYVHDTDFEKSLNDFLNSKVSAAKFCVGYTGIGKTTSIRYCLGIKTSNAPCLLPARKMIVFPTFLDGYRLEDMNRFDLAKRVAGVCTSLEVKHPELISSIQTAEGRKEFYQFMLRHNGFALENVDHITAMTLSEDERIMYCLKEAYKADTFIYQANRLKFYIYKKRDLYNRLVILLDDIETLPQEHQRRTIKKYLKLFDCMKNTDYEDNLDYNVNLLISMRPHTHRYLYGDRDIETFPLSNPILKREAVDLSALFKNRFDFYSRKFRSRSTIGNIDSWMECYKAIMRMNDTFDGKYKKMIQSLCFFNIRESLSAYARIFANRLWVQRNMEKVDAFTVTPSDYVFNNVTVIRALGCNEEQVYFENSNLLIPNFFYTTEMVDYSIQCLMIMRYFIKKRGGADYGINAESLKIIREEFNSVLEKEYVEQFICAIQYLFDNKVLRKSIFEYDDADTIDKLEEDSKLYISPRGNELLNMLARDSVLLEMMRESAWRNYKNRDFSIHSSFDLAQMKDYSSIYIDLLDYIDYLSEMEDDIFIRGIQPNRYQDFFALFGNSTVSSILLSGVKKSIEYFDDSVTYKVIKSKLRQTEEKVKNLQMRIVNL